MTPSQAKNAISKALLEIIDPSPNNSKERTIRAFFENRCAYCGRDIPPLGRTGHIDHLVPRQNGGTNHISNLVLACNICNGDEKLDQDWRAFIQQKVSNVAERQQRIDRIEKWITEEGGPTALSPEMLADVERVRSKVFATFDHATKELKENRSNKALHATRLPVRQARA